jgi:hypothetical protein
MGEVRARVNESFGRTFVLAAHAHQASMMCSVEFTS